ncbi:MAG: response regulator [Bacteroidetes bacterium]|nr:MAG: response regulator [Bacteroidota bacterium]
MFFPADGTFPLRLRPEPGSGPPPGVNRRDAPPIPCPRRASIREVEYRFSGTMMVMDGKGTLQERMAHPHQDPHPDKTTPPSLSILLVEDNLINRKVALLMLNKLGYDADVAVNGREAVEAVQRRRYDLLLMDLQMPEMNGLEATEEIRRILPPERQPRIVAFTANALSVDRQRCLDAGMDDYLSKPVRQYQLVAVLAASTPAGGRTSDDA